MRAPKGKRASTIGAENDPANDPPLSELESSRQSSRQCGHSRSIARQPFCLR
jgi:hypothetical protein